MTLVTVKIFVIVDTKGVNLCNQKRSKNAWFWNRKTSQNRERLINYVIPPELNKLLVCCIFIPVHSLSFLMASGCKLLNISTLVFRWTTKTNDWQGKKIIDEINTVKRQLWRVTSKMLSSACGNSLVDLFEREPNHSALIEIQTLGSSSYIWKLLQDPIESTFLNFTDPFSTICLSCPLSCKLSVVLAYW